MRQPSGTASASKRPTIATASDRVSRKRLSHVTFTSASNFNAGSGRSFDSRAAITHNSPGASSACA